MAPGIGISSWVWTGPFTDESLGLLARVREMGFDSFSLAIEDPSHVDPHKVKAAIEASGLRPNVAGAFGAPRDLTHDDPRYHRETLDYIGALLKMCELWGAKLIVGPMYAAVGKRRPLPDDQRKREWERAVVGLRKAAAMAADAGVVLGIEAINRFETDLVNTAEQCLRLVQDIDHPAVGVHLDTFHMHIEEKDVYQAIKRVGSRLVYVDASESDRGTPGTGQVDWDGIARGLKEIGYVGDCVIESFLPECHHIAAMAGIWRRPAPSSDELAREGLRFLRAKLA